MEYQGKIVRGDDYEGMVELAQIIADTGGSALIQWSSDIVQSWNDSVGLTIGNPDFYYRIKPPERTEITVGAKTYRWNGLFEKPMPSNSDAWLTARGGLRETTHVPPKANVYNGRRYLYDLVHAYNFPLYTARQDMPDRVWKWTSLTECKEMLCGWWSSSNYTIDAGLLGKNLSVQKEKIISEAEARSITGPSKKTNKGFRYTGACVPYDHAPNGCYYFDRSSTLLRKNGGRQSEWCYLVEKIEKSDDVEIVCDGASKVISRKSAVSLGLIDE